MLEVKHLTKIFKSKNNNSVVALNDISFILPNTGMAFIVGKSGSGKSTLLNMLGVLDKPTSGEVIFNSIYLNKLSNQNYAYYRNFDVGFIFQDFKLIDNLTIFENIEISLKLQRNYDTSSISSILKKVGLEGYENRYPKELSGGQKQRVAICRCLIKNPKIILADEPTGNLDEETSKEVLELLKEVSKTCLVVIVSHNSLDARKYADRIIELSYGKIINDVVKSYDSQNSCYVENETLYFPLHEKLTLEDEHLIKENLRNKNIKHIKQIDQKFLKYEENSQKQENIELTHQKSHFKFIDSLKIGLKFLKNKIFGMTFYSLVVSSLICVLCVSQLIAHYDDVDVVSRHQQTTSENILFLKKDLEIVNDTNQYSQKLNIVNDEDRKIIESLSQTNDVYPIYNLAQPIYNDSLTYADIFPIIVPTNFKLFETFGTVVTNKDYLTSIYGKNGKLDFIALDQNEKPYGVYISDYVADSLMFFKPAVYPTYDSILGSNTDDKHDISQYINGIFKTDYNIKYKDELKLLRNTTTLTKDISQNKKVINLLNEIKNSLAINYSFEDNFIETYVDSGFRHNVSKSNLKFTYENNEIINKNRINIFDIEHTEYKGDLGDYECLMGFNFANSLFKTSYTEETINQFTPRKIKLTYNTQDFNNSRGEAYSFEITVKALSNIDYLIVGTKVFKELLGKLYFQFGFHIANCKNKKDVMKKAYALGFTDADCVSKSITDLAKIIKTFSLLFLLIDVLLLLIYGMILIHYNLKELKDKLYDIGVIKSLGATNFDILIIFSLQTIIMTFAIAILFFIESIFFIKLANLLLTNSIFSLASAAFISKDVVFLIMNPVFIIIDILIAFIISLVSLTIPAIKLRNINPQNIILKRN